MFWRQLRSEIIKKSILFLYFLPIFYTFCFICIEFALKKYTIWICQHWNFEIKSHRFVELFAAAHSAHIIFTQLLGVHTSLELYLAVRCLVGWYGYRGWAVRSELSGGDAYLRSGIAPTMCPADQRVTRNDWHWGYRNNKRDKWSDLPELVVKCSTHANHWNKCMELNLFNQQCMCLLNRMCLNCLNATFHNYLGRVSQQISSPY